MLSKRTFFLAICRIFVIMKRAIVIGASSGLGNELAHLLLQDGWAVGVAARRIEKLNEWKAQEKQRFCLQGSNGEVCHGVIETAQIDVCRDDAATLLYNLIERMGGVDLYVHVSGVGKQNAALDETIELDTVQTNAMGFSRMVGAAYRYMAEHGGGQIAVVSSVAGTKGLGPAPSYSATKALQSTYIQALEQLANSRNLNICFTDLQPGFVDTPLLNGKSYPILMKQSDVAKAMLKAIKQRKHVCVLDWRWAVLVTLWRLIPNWLWRRLRLTT